MEKINLQIKNEAGMEIDIDCRFHRSDSALPIIIFCHGFKGFKDWGGFPYMMEKLAEAGFCSVSFNFSLNGVSKENPAEFTKPENFAANTFTQELNDLKAVVDFFRKRAANYNADENRIGLMGHSRGGGTALLYAASDPRIKAAATLASVSSFDRYGRESKKKWRKNGFLEIENSRTGQIMRLNITLLDDIEKNSESLDIKEAVSKINVPLLIIHGKEDLSVKYREAEELYENSDKTKTELLLIENAGHTFGVVHPFGGTAKPFEIAIERVIKFFGTNL